MMARTNVLSALALSVAFAAEADVLHVFREPYHDLLVSAAGLADVRTTVELNDGWSGEVKPEKGPGVRKKEVALPHNWSDYHGMRRLGHGNLHGTATYRRTFDVTKTAGKCYALVFDGIGTYATVRVNGREICRRRPAGRLVTTLDVSAAVRDGPNDLEVICEHPSDIVDMPWVCGGCGPQSCEGPEPFGLFRPARLVVTDEVRVAPFGVQIWYDEDIKSVSVAVEVVNGSAAEVVRELVVVQPELGVAVRKRLALAAGETRRVVVEAPLKGAKRWSPRTPNLYTFAAELRDAEGVLRDRETARTGFRTITWPKTNPKGDPRFFVNGEPVYIHGVCETDHRFGGSMAFSRAEIDARCDEIEKLAFNAFRDGHEPHDLHYNERWDEDGVLWWPQISTHVYHDTDAFRENFRAAIIQWIKERRNSPSVVLWGLQNESIMPDEVAREFTELIHRLDPLSGRRGRLVTSCNGGIGVDWDVIQDWSGTYGGRFGVIENYQNALREKKELLNGEYGAWRVAGFHDDPDKPFVFNEPNTEEHAARVLWLKMTKAWSVRDEVCGQFLWTFFTHENPGRAWPDDAYRLIDKVGPINNKGPYTLWGRRTEAWYLYLAHAHYLRAGTLDPLSSKPLSWWLAEGRRLAAPEKTPDIRPRPERDRMYVFRLNCGGDAVVDSLGETWQADDTRYVHSWAMDDDMGIDSFELCPVLGSQDRVWEGVVNVPAEEDRVLFETFRFGRNRLRFDLPAPADADCTVEAYFVDPGSYGRVFDVALNGRTVEREFNLGRMPERNVIRRAWTVRTGPEGGIVLTFPKVDVNQAVVSALAVSCSAADAARMPRETRKLGYPAGAGLSWARLEKEVAVKTPVEMMPGGEKATIFPIMANQPPPPDRDGYKVGWFGPHYAKDYTVVFRVKKGNPIGRTLVWKLDDDHHEATYGSGEFKVERLNAEGKIEMRLPLQVNAGWYVIMYRMDGVELVATEWR